MPFLHYHNLTSPPICPEICFFIQNKKFVARLRGYGPLVPRIRQCRLSVLLTYTVLTPAVESFFLSSVHWHTYLKPAMWLWCIHVCKLWGESSSFPHILHVGTSLHPAFYTCQMKPENYYIIQLVPASSTSLICHSLDKTSPSI